ncbi:MAG: preprotein translocase subunit SecG [Clostridiales bacterium]|nr:preprotein translocase subunit SecG [Clostridiales bacterium]
MSTAQLVVNILLIISSLVMIVSVLLQKGDDDAMSALTGGSSDSFFGKNKAKTAQGRLALLTKISASVFVALALLMIFID